MELDGSVRAPLTALAAADGYEADQPFCSGQTAGRSVVAEIITIATIIADLDTGDQRGRRDDRPRAATTSVQQVKRPRLSRRLGFGRRRSSRCRNDFRVQAGSTLLLRAGIGTWVDAALAQEQSAKLQEAWQGHAAIGGRPRLGRESPTRSRRIILLLLR